MAPGAPIIGGDGDAIRQGDEEGFGVVGIDGDVLEFGDLPGGKDAPGAAAIGGADATIAGGEVEDARVAAVIVEGGEERVVVAEVIPGFPRGESEEAARRELGSDDVALGCGSTEEEAMGLGGKGQGGEGEDSQAIEPKHTTSSRSNVAWGANCWSLACRRKAHANCLLTVASSTMHAGGRPVQAGVVIGSEPVS